MQKLKPKPPTEVRKMERYEALQRILKIAEERDYSDLSIEDPEIQADATAYQVVYYMLADEIKNQEQNAAVLYEADLMSRKTEILRELGDINDSLGVDRYNAFYGCRRKDE